MFKYLSALAIAAAMVVSVTLLVPAGQLAGSATSPPGTHVCTDPTTVTSSPSGEAGYGGASAVSQDVWNHINISQTLDSCAMNSWYVTASAGESGDNGAVQSYPDSNVTLASATPLSSFTTLTSNMRITDPPTCVGTDYEAANDIWWGGPTEWSGPSTEMMIWAYTCNQVPAGSELPGTVSLSGEAYSVWLSGTPGDGNIITFESTAPYESDHTDLLAFADYAQSGGYLPNANLWQVGSGFELCYTNGSQTFQQTAFNLWGNGVKITG